MVVAKTPEPVAASTAGKPLILLSRLRGRYHRAAPSTPCGRVVLTAERSHAARAGLVV